MLEGSQTAWLSLRMVQTDSSIVFVNQETKPSNAICFGNGCSETTGKPSRY